MEVVFDVFLSFNSRDRDLANQVYSFLTENGLKVFFSDEELRGTPSFVRKINEALTNSKDFLLVTSSQYHVMPVADDNMIGSDWVADEIEKFIIINNNRRKKGKEKGKLTSFRTNEVPLEELPIDFQKDSTAILYTESADCWDMLLGCFQSYPKSDINITEAEFIGEWLETQSKKLSELKMSIASGDVDYNRLSDVYVSLPIDVSVTISVKNGKVDTIADSELPNVHMDICDSKYSSMQESIDNMIKNGVEYKYKNVNLRPKILSPVWNDGLKKEYWVLNAIDAIATNDKLVVIGDPGLGKSTLLRFLSITLATQYFSEENKFDTISLSNEFYMHRYLPVYIEVRDLIPWVGQQDDAKYDFGTISKYICKKILKGKYYHATSIVEKALLGRCLFIFDGLDEVASSDFNKNIVCSIINDIEKMSKDSKIVLSCRERDYPSWDFADIPTVNLQLMDDQIMYQLAKKIFASHRTKERPESLFNQLAEMNVDAKLCGNPLLLSLVANLYLRGAGVFPKNKSTIIKESISLLLERKCDDLISAVNCDLREIIETLEEIAYEMQTKDNGNELKISRRDMNGIIGDHMENCSLANSIKFFKATAGVIAARDSTEFEFTHRHFQEFLCASYLSKQALKDAREIIKEGLLTSPTRWSETCLLFIEILQDNNRVDDLWSMLYNLLKSVRGLSDTNQCWIVWYASSIIASRNFRLLPQFDDDYDERNDVTIDFLREAIKNLLNYNKALPIMQRIECAKTLGMIGDDRNGVGVINGIPDHEWCMVDNQGCEFEMGVSEYVENLIRNQHVENNYWGSSTSFSRETPAKMVKVSPYYLSKYETTNAQYLAFVESSDGYRCIDWWTWCPAALAWHQSNSPEDRGQALKKLAEYRMNCPVTYVSFYEAVAYCKWLTSKTKERIRMPTEGEWEYAAKLKNPVFSWGNQFDENRCNSSYSGIGDITPVGVYETPENSSLPCEMNGNAWEWCQSIYPSWDNDVETLEAYSEERNYINTDMCYNISDEMRVAVRGGSFLNPPALLRSTFRGRDKMGDAFYRQGFRVMKEITEHPWVQPIGTACPVQKDQHNLKVGAGKKITVGDRVRIAYKAYKNGVLIEDRMLPESAVEVTIGHGELNSEIEQYILDIGASVATTFEKEFLMVDSLVSNVGMMYKFSIFIQECK